MNVTQPLRRSPNEAIVNRRAYHTLTMSLKTQGSVMESVDYLLCCVGCNFKGFFMHRILVGITTAASSIVHWHGSLKESSKILFRPTIVADHSWYLRRISI